MHCRLRSVLLALVFLWPQGSTTFPSLPSSNDLASWITGSPSLSWDSDAIPLQKRQSQGNLESNPNGSTFLWTLQDTFQGSTFFDNFSFFTGADPTHGLVNYVNASTAFSSGLAYVQDNGKVIMHGDNTTWLASGVGRASVRISSYAQYNTGLFILDVDKVPWGCAVWPAFWTVGGGNWPTTGEVDIIEGVHDNQHNQVAWHTAPNCSLDSSVNMTGQIKQNGDGSLDLQCNALLNSNSGCGVTEWSRASYGASFDAQGGGVFAMKWDENGIAVWSFYRAAVPQDILQGTPTPSTWGVPVAALAPTYCSPLSNFFVNHSMIFDITFCGDWAGNSYATTTCPGTCEERLMDPSNFINATWIINYLKVYKKQPLYGSVSSAAVSDRWTAPVSVVTTLLLFAFGLIL